MRYILLILLTLTLLSVMLFFVSEAVKNLGRKQFLEFMEEFRELVQAVRDLRPNTPSQARIKLVPKTIDVGGSANATLTVLDQFGKPFTLNSSYIVTPSASNLADVGFGTVNPDGSFVVNGIAADPGDSIGAVITGNGVNITATADVLVVNAPVPVPTSATLVLS